MLTPKIPFMKKRYIKLLLVVLLPISAFGQLQKGTWMLGGSAILNTPLIVNYDDPTIEDQSMVDFLLTPNVSYFISKRWAVGAGFVGFLSFQTENGNVNGGIGLIPQVRYYFNPDNAKRNWFATVGGGFSSGIGFTSSGFEIETSTLLAGVGVNHFLTPNIALEGLAGVNWDGENDTEVRLNLGLQFFLRKKTEETPTITPALGKGTILLGGSGSISNQRGDFWNLQLLPNLGVFLSERLVVGGKLQASYSFNTNSTDFRFSALGLSPFIRYYLNPASGRLLWFLAAEAGIVAGKARGNEQFQFEQDYSNFNAAGKVGINYFLAPNVALEGTLGLDYGGYKNTSSFRSIESTTLRVGADFGFQFFLAR